MIRNLWYPIFDSSWVKPNQVVGITRLGEKLVLWRRADREVACMSDRCSHRGALLSRGRVKDGCLECPYHGLRFTSSGRCVRIPANGLDVPVPRTLDMPTRLIREEHGLIWLWHGESEDAASQLPWFDTAPEPNRGVASFQREFPVSYLRIMENLTDFHHAPFVHRWTIPGLGPRVDDFKLENPEDELAVTCTMRHYRDAKDSKRGVTFITRIKLPTLATIEVFPGVRFVLTATPIDAERTWLYVRYGQDYVPWWLGGKILAWLAVAWDFNLVFSRQDMPILRSQQLTDPEDISSYHLFPADRGATAFFAMRKRLLQRKDAGPSGERFSA